MSAWTCRWCNGKADPRPTQRLFHFGNKPEAILIGDHGLSCLLPGKLSLRDLRLLQQYLPRADIPPMKRQVHHGAL